MIRRRFNGAALVRVRRCGMVKRHRQAADSFNGAALVRVRRSEDAFIQHVIAEVLQRGRTRESAEIAAGIVNSLVIVDASTGPHS